MRGWFVSDDGMARFRVKDVTGIDSHREGAAAFQGAGSWSLSVVERDRLIAQIEAENADPTAAKEQMFHYDGGQSAFPLTAVRSWVTYPEAENRRKVTVVNLFDMPGANLFGDDTPRFLAAMGVPNEPT